MGASKRIAIIGAGAAGLAAASRLTERGLSPVLISRGTGASSMTSGAADLTPWTQPHPLGPSASALAFVRALGLFESEGRVATAEGVLRPTSAVGARVLNLQQFSGKRIGVADLPRADFRPGTLADQLNQTMWARSTNTHFEVVPLSGVVSEGELQFPLAAFQRLFDDEERIVRLQSSAQSLSSRVQALLLGPWLGEGRTPIESGGISMGETLSPPEGAFGRRFEKARREFCGGLGLEIRAEWVETIALEDEQMRLTTLSTKSESRGTLWADSVIVATGGLVGHGIGVFESPSGPMDLRALLDPAAPPLLGAKEGWDAAHDGGHWVSPPHDRRVSKIAADSRVVFAGDVRRKVSSSAPGGTFLGAVQSGLDAAGVLSGG